MLEILGHAPQWTTFIVRLRLRLAAALEARPRFEGESSMRNTGIPWLSLLVTLSVAACGGETSGDGSAGCGTTTGCGGDVVGTWHVTSVCVEVAPTFVDTTNIPPECLTSYQTALKTMTAQPQNLTIAMAADGTYQETGSMTTSFTWVLDSRCFTAMGGSLSASTCASLPSGLDPNGPAATCTFVTSVCRCTFTDTQTVSRTGTYRTSGTTLYTDENDPTHTGSGPYCVKGTSMGYSETTSDATAAYELTR